MSENNILSNNFSNNESSVDFFGFGAICNSILKYRQWQISLTQKNKESLYHVIKKDALSANEKTKSLIETILNNYQKNEGYLLSMRALRILEYMDDDLYDAILRSDKCIQNPDDKDHKLLLEYGLITKTETFEVETYLVEGGCYKELEYDAYYTSDTHPSTDYDLLDTALELRELIEKTEDEVRKKK